MGTVFSHSEKAIRGNLCFFVSALSLRRRSHARPASCRARLIVRSLTSLKCLSIFLMRPIVTTSFPRCLMTVFTISFLSESVRIGVGPVPSSLLPSQSGFSLNFWTIFLTLRGLSGALSGFLTFFTICAGPAPARCMPMIRLRVQESSCVIEDAGRLKRMPMVTKPAGQDVRGLKQYFSK